MDKIIPVTMKEWLSWPSADEYEGKIRYIRIYSFNDKDEFIVMRHIEEKKKIRNGDIETISYSIVTKIAGRFNAHHLFNSSDELRVKVEKLNKNTQVFSFHHNDATTIQTFFELFTMKKADKIRFEYYPENDTQFIKERLPGYHYESLSLSFTVKEKTFLISIDHIPNHVSTMYISEYPGNYHPGDLYKEAYPDKTPVMMSCSHKGITV